MKFQNYAKRYAYTKTLTTSPLEALNAPRCWPCRGVPGMHIGMREEEEFEGPWLVSTKVAGQV